MEQQRTTASEPSSPNEAECKVRTFYSVGDVSEEVDSHFAKALSVAAAKHVSPCSSQPTSPTLPTVETTSHDTDASSNPSSPTPSCVTNSLPTIANVTSIVTSTYTSPEAMASQAAGSIAALQHHPPFHSAGSHSPEKWPFSGPLQPSKKGRIIYPEFVNFLVHPEVDSFKDLPKLPGQSDSPPPCPLDWQPAWSADTTGISRCSNKGLEQLSSQNRSTPTKGYHSERKPLQLGSDTASHDTENVFGSHEHLYTSSPYQPPTSSPYQPPTSSHYQPPTSSHYQPPTSSPYQPLTSSHYQPPTSSHYQPPLLPVQPVDLRCHRGLETRHSQPSQMPYTENPLSTTTEHLQLQSGLEFTDDELKEILELREHDI